MDRSAEITTLFLDVGRVLLTNGWGHPSHGLPVHVRDTGFVRIAE